MVTFEDLPVLDGCKNLEQSYGEICVKCNKCCRFEEEHWEVENKPNRFYEFNKAEYYALIVAKNIDGAMDEYKECVNCEFLGDEHERPVEIAPEDAKKKLHEARKYEDAENYSEENIDNLFSRFMNSDYADLILVDSNLV